MNGYQFDKPLYKYRGFENAKILLETGTWYFNCPAQFNDPFEFNERLLDLSFSKEFVQNHINGIPQVKKMPRKDRRKLSNNDQRPLFTNSVRTAIENARNNYGVFCGSELYDNTLMWSHYADNHKGICLGFEFPQTNDFFLNFVKEKQILSTYVNYVDSITPASCISEDGILFPNTTLDYWFSTKSRVWEYEKELRLIKHTNKGPIAFSPSWLKKVYFGLLTPDTHIKEIVSLVKCKYRKCIFYKMEFKKNSFQLTSKQIN